jgi:hypothetical protein
MKPQAVDLDLAPRVDCGGEGISGFFQRRIRRLFAQRLALFAQRARRIGERGVARANDFGQSSPRATAT